MIVVIEFEIADQTRQSQMILRIVTLTPNNVHFLLQCMSHHSQLKHAGKELHASSTRESIKLHERRFSLKIATKCSNSVQIHILSRISQIYGISDIGNMLPKCC